MNRAYWRPAFTVAMVNRLSGMDVGSIHSEFTVTPMQNVPLGRIKSKSFTSGMLDESQLAAYYACYRHLTKMVRRDTLRETRDNLLRRTGMSMSLNLGGWGLLRLIERKCDQRGVDVEKVKHGGLEETPLR